MNLPTSSPVSRVTGGRLLQAVRAAVCTALVLSAAPSRAAEAPACQVAVAALNLPPGSTGMVHWRCGDEATTPLQLSTRYFSERLKLRAPVIRFYDEAVPAAQPEPPEPVLSLRIPANQKLVYIVLRSETGEDKQPRWRGSMLSAADWKEGSMKVFNAANEPLGISAGTQRFKLDGGRSVDFHARDWKESFPVKIFRLQPETRTLFSSTWRVTAARRELCFIGNVNGAISLRSLLDFAPPPPEDAPE